MLDRGADIDAGNYTVLMFAIDSTKNQSNKKHMVQFVLEHGANMNATTEEGQKPVNFASWRLKYSLIENVGEDGKWRRK